MAAKKLIKKKKAASKSNGSVKKKKRSSRKPKIVTVGQATRAICGKEKSTAKTKARKKQELEDLRDNKISFVRNKGNLAARLQAEIDYIQDDQQRSLDYHYNRVDRNYKELVGPRIFRRWSEVGGWVQKRTDFWDNIKGRVLGELEEQIFQTRLKEITQIEKTKELFYEYLEPLRDKGGEILRDTETGKPRFALQLPTLEGMMRLVLMMSERQSILRGDVVSRSEEIHHGVFKVQETKINMDPIAQLSNLSEDQAHKFARALMAIKNPQLQGDFERLEQQTIVDAEVDDEPT